MNEIVSEIMRLHGIKHYALLPIEGGALIMYFAPYSPYDYSEFPDCLKIDSYYITSNKVYFENLQLLQSLKAKGLDAKRYRRTDIKQLLDKYRLADYGMNGLCFVKEYGSFFFVATAFVEGAETEFFSSIPPFPTPFAPAADCVSPPARRTRLVPDGFIKNKCLRQIQEEYADTPENNAALKRNGRLLGCNICQLVCPLNSHIKPVPPPQELVELCNKDSILETVENEQTLQRLIPLIGKNYARKSFLLPLARAFFK